MLGVVSWGRLWRLCLKELRETLRDRRTIITLVLMPLLVYPLLSLTLQRVLLTSTPGEKNEKYFVGVSDKTTGEVLLQLIEKRKKLLDESNQLNIDIQWSEPKGEGVPEDVFKRGDGKVPELIVMESYDAFDKALESPMIDVSCRVVLVNDRGNQPPRQVFQLTYRPDDLRSEQALRLVQDIVATWDNWYAESVFGKVKPQASWPAQLVARPWKARKSTTSPLATIVPLVLILMTITGAVYPAIDLTAGERERGTMEVLVASPTPRWALLFSKYVAVVTVALLTAVANLGSMFTTLSVTGLGRLVFGESGVSFSQIIQVFALLVLFSMFFASVLLALTSFARSFKEAQAYLIPVMLLALAPGVMSLLPGIEFTPLFAVIPLVNIVLLARDILTDKVDALLAVAAIISTMVYAGAALAIAAKLFGSDAMFQGSRGSWKDLVARPERPVPLPLGDQMALFLAGMFPLYFLLSNVLNTMGEQSLSFRLWFNAIVTAFLFGLLPWFYSWYQRFDLRRTFLLNWPSGWVWLAVPASMLLGTSLWMAAHELILISGELGLSTLRPEQIESVKKMVEQFQAISPVIVLITLAFTPALFEEFFFRGFVLSSLHRFSRTKAILISSVLFGLFHVAVGSVLALERFLPTTLIGLFLGWIAVRTRSLWPGIALHATHNGLLLMTAYYSKQLQENGIGASEQSHLPVTWLLTGSVVGSISLSLLYVATRSVKGGAR